MNTDEIEKLLAEATPGPWDVDPHGIDDCMGDVWLGEEIRVCENVTAEDARLIAMAPDLAAEVVRLRKALGLYANPQNWKMSGPCDPNGPNFIGEEHARAALEGRE